MIAKEKLTRDKFNALKKYYDKTWDEKEHTLHVGFFGMGAKTLEKSYIDATKYLLANLNRIRRLDDRSNILDVGCGTGRTLMAACAKYGCRGVGVDLSDEQIKDAKNALEKINIIRKRNGLNPLKIRFVRGSGSELRKLLPRSKQFTHVLSQDALLFVVDKESLFKNMFRLLVPGGALAIADFLAEKPQSGFSAHERRTIYKMLNWNEDLSFVAYIRFLRTVGFKMIGSEERGRDMVKTYSLLGKSMRRYLRSSDATYSDLAKRYADIVSAVKKGKMGWGLFFAVKQ
jgi:cyclopropane fatty-acyl-phospholipid synthase-like methyltransferase